MAFYTGDMFAAWKGDLIVSALAGQQIRRVNLDKGVVASQETFLADRGERYRQVVQAPDGALLVLTDEDEGKVLRLTPG
jgi:glucose/arabinose dehydrogenase